MIRNTEIANAEPTMPTRIICRHGFSRDCRVSMPAAFASTSARSRMLTINWSRRFGDSSRRVNRAITNTANPTMPQMVNWSCHAGRLPRV